MTERHKTVSNAARGQERRASAGAFDSGTRTELFRSGKGYFARGTLEFKLNMSVCLPGRVRGETGRGLRLRCRPRRW
jgi:hypothetical protein